MSNNQTDLEFENQLGEYHKLYCNLVGSIVSHLQSLEFLLRAYLYTKKDNPHNPLPVNKKLYEFDIGEWVPENAMTCYDPLDNLIDRYNKLVGKEVKIDRRSIVALRDLIAHGRASAIKPSPNFRLIKFSKSNEGMVKVETSVEVTEAWLKDQLKLTSDAVNTVADCLNKLQGELDKPPHSANSDS